jgi:hypothetical protein
LCQEASIQDGLCRTHYIEEAEKEYLDNRDMHNLGIIKWARRMLPQYMRNDTPEMHLVIMYALLSLYNPLYKMKYERLLLLINFRGSAKSTLVNFLIPMYIIAHNGMTMRLTLDVPVLDGEGNYLGDRTEEVECKIKESLICIVSETGTSAEEFTVRIRDEYTTNRTLKYFYAFQIEDAMDDLTGQWTKKAFKINGTFVIGVGSGQQIRGKVRGAWRPTLLIGDDIYSGKNTKTPETRANIRRWWNDEVMNTVDDVEGKVVLCGTIVHEDTVLVDLEKNSQWKKVKFRLMDLDKFRKFVKEHIQVDPNTGESHIPFDTLKNENERIIRQRNYFRDVQNSLDWGLTWPDRIDLYYVATKFQEAMKNRKIDGFYQEYFHIVISDEEKRYHASMFQKLPPYRLFKKYGYHWFECPTLYKRPQVIKMRLSLDMSSGKDGRDDSCLTVTGALPDSRRLVFHQSFGKFSMRDALYEENPLLLRHNLVMMDRTLVKKYGFIDEAFRLVREWEIEEFYIGVAGEESLITPEVIKIFRANEDYETQIYERAQTGTEGHKVQRIKNTTMHYYETYMVYHAEGLMKLESQLEFLGHGANDDLADSLEVSFYELTNPFFMDYDILEKKLGNFNDENANFMVDEYGILIEESPLDTGEDWRTM